MIRPETYVKRDVLWAIAFSMLIIGYMPFQTYLIFNDTMMVNTKKNLRHGNVDIQIHIPKDQKTRAVNIIYSTDFESGLSGWATSGGWYGLTTSRYHSASHSSTDSIGDYSDLCDVRFYMTQGVDLSQYNEAYLSFWHYMSVEDNWDGGIVEVSTNGGNSWTQLDPNNNQGNYDGVINPGWGNALSNKYAFCRDHTNWVEVTFDISDYCGYNDVRFAFRFASDSYTGYGQDGWYIDDVSVYVPNAIPSANIISITPQVGLLGTTFSFSGTGVDSDGTIVSYAWDFDGDGTWDDSNPNTTYQYPEIGEYWPKFKVTDNLGADSPIVTPSNPVIVHLRPVATINSISPSPALLGNEVTFIAEGYDNDGDQIINYNWTSDVDGQLYVGPNQVFKTTTLSKGIHNISLTVQDEHGVWSQPVSIQLEVLAAPIAVIDTVDPTTITYGEAVHLVGHGTHEYASIVAYEWYAVCGGIPEIIGTSNDITYTGLRPGTNTILFRVKIDEAHGGYWSAFTTTQVTVNPTTNAPTAIITNPSSDTLVEFGNSIQLTGTGTGGSGTIVEYQWGHVNQDNISDLGPLGNASQIDVNLQVGVHEVYLQVKDSNGEWSSPAMILVDVDRRPQITYFKPEQSSVTINEGESITFNITAFDPDYDTIRYTWYINGKPQPNSNLPSFKFDTAGNYTSQGTYTITVIVDDGAGRLSDDTSWTLVVENVNQPPEITSYYPSEKTVVINEGESVTFSVNVTDVDVGVVPGETITYQWYIDNEAITGATSHTYTYSSDYESEGRYEIRVNITCGSDKISWGWILKVMNTNRKPRIISYYPSSTSILLNQDSIQKFSINATDDDSSDVYKLAYLWYWDDELIEDASDNVYILYCSSSILGYHTLEVLVKDSGGEIDRVEWHINITNVNHEPIILSQSPNPTEVHEINEGESITFNVTAYDPDDDTNNNGNIDDGYPPGEVNFGERNNLSFIWYVNDIKQEPVGHGNTGGIFTFTADYTGEFSSENSPFTIRVEVTDGEYSIPIEWNVIVNNVNRKPVILITSPAKDEREISVNDTLILDASDSYDPDNDTLSFSWYIDGKLVSSSPTYEKTGLSPGDHQIKIEVSDGIDVTDETFSVRVTGVSYEGIKVYIYEFKPVQPKSGEPFSVTVKVENNGDSPVTNIVVALYEDETEVDKKTLSLDGGEARMVTLNTTAKSDVTYTVQVVGADLDIIPVPVNVVEKSGRPSAEKTIAGMNPRTFVLMMVIIIMLSTLIVVFGIIKFTEWKIAQEEMKREAAERARLASISEDEAQYVLEMEAAKAAMMVKQEQATQQEAGAEAIRVVSDEIYTVEPTAEIYDPTGNLKAEMESMGMTATEEQEASGSGSQQYGLPPMDSDKKTSDEIDDIFGDTTHDTYGTEAAKGDENDLEDLFR